MRGALVLAILLASFVLAACGGGPNGGSNGPTGGPTGAAAGSPTPGAPGEAGRPTPTRAPAAIVARELPAQARTWNPEQQLDGSFIVEAVSSPAIEVGVAYRYLIGTHCGITPTTFDVGGSFWDPIVDPSTFRLPEPEDDGVFVLASAADAVWTSSSGFEIRLVRGPADPRQVFFCD